MGIQNIFNQMGYPNGVEASPTEELYEQQRRYDFYYGKYHDYIVDLLKNHLAKKTYRDFHKVWINILRKAVDRRAGGMYRQNPSRVIAGGDADKLMAILRPDALNLAMDKASRYMENHRTAILRVVWRHQRIEYDVLPPTMFRVDEGFPDPTRLEDADSLSLYSKPRTRMSMNPKDDRIEVWTTNPAHKTASDAAVPQWMEVDGHGKILKQGNNPYTRGSMLEGSLEYVYPAVALQAEEPDATFLIQGGGEIAVAALYVAFEYTDMALIDRLQSFGVPVFSGGGTVTDMTVSPTKGISLGENQTFTFEAPPGSLKERRDGLRQFISHLAQTLDLPADTFDERNRPESGVARRIAGAPLTAYRESLAKRLESVESKLWPVIVAVYNAWNSDNDKIPEDSTLETTLVKIDLPLDPTEAVLVMREEMALGLIHPADILAERLGVSREEAMSVWEENKAAAQSMGVLSSKSQIRSGNNVPRSPEPEEDEPEPDEEDE